MRFVISEEWVWSIPENKPIPVVGSRREMNKRLPVQNIYLQRKEDGD